MKSKYLNINWTTEEGWYGMYTRDQAKGAIPNGTRVRKINSEPKDGHPDGSLATIIGSFGPDKPMEVLGHSVRFLYFVEFDDLPKVGIGITEWRIEVINN